MANKKITELPLITGISGSTALPIVTGGTTNKITAENFVEFSRNIIRATANTFTQNQTITGNLSVSGTTVIGGNTTIGGNVVVAGRLTAQEYQTELVSASIIYESGSTKFGDDTGDIHQITGSLTISGSLLINGIDLTSYSASTANTINNISASTANTTNNISSSNSQTFNNFFNSQQSVNSLNATYTASNNLRFGLMQAYTASNDVRFGIVQAYTASNAGVVSILQAYTASNAGVVSNLQAYTASNAGVVSNLQAYTASNDIRFALNQQYTASNDLRFGLMQQYTASNDVRFGIVQSYTASNAGVVSNLQAYTASNDLKTTDILSYTASNAGVVSNIQSYTASLKNSPIVSSSTQIQNYDLFALNSNLYTSTGSLIGITNGLMAYTSSLKGAIQISGQDVNVLGMITAQQFNVTYVSSSVMYQSGSTKFGDSYDDTHEITGSLNVTGSILVNGLSASLGSGTAKYITRFISSSIIGNSLLYDDGVNIGLGTITPTSQMSGLTGLGIYNFANPAISFKNNQTTWITYTSANTYNIYNTTVGDVITLVNTPYPGRVGIVQSSPAYTLDVNGTFGVSGLTTFSDRVTAPAFAGSITGSILATNNVVSSSTQILNYNTFAVTSSGNTFYGNQTINGSLTTADFVQTSTLQGTGSLFLQPDLNDSRALRIYNTAPSDIHIKANSVLSYFGDDTNYLLIDDSNGDVTLRANRDITLHANNGDIILNSDGSVYVRSVSAGNAVITDGYLSGIIGNTNVVNNSTGNTITDNLTNIINSIPSITHLATTGSNTFIGNQTITGSLLVSGSSHTIQNGYVILQQVSQSLNFVDDTAAAAGGVPLGGLYRNGNFIVIRIS